VYSIRGTGPTYFRHICTPIADVSGRVHLRSAERRDMLVPRTRTELGRRSFQVAAPTVWNSLPAHLRSTLISRRQFRDGLKSHLFTEAYFWSSENICFKGSLHSKFTLGFCCWPKSMYFWEIFTMKTISIDAVVTEIFKAEMWGRLVRSLELPPSYI